MLPSFVPSTRLVGSGSLDKLRRVNHDRREVATELDNSTERTVCKFNTDSSALLFPTFEASAVTDIEVLSACSDQVAVNHERQAESVAVKG
jgi:hypothetical protein